MRVSVTLRSTSIGMDVAVDPFEDMPDKTRERIEERLDAIDEILEDTTDETLDTIEGTLEETPDEALDITLKSVEGKVLESLFLPRRSERPLSG
jgi:hypothetical protein